MVSVFRDPALEIIQGENDVTKVIGLGPVQPRGISFPTTNILAGDRLKALKFQESWYNGREWLEYSISKDEAYCFYCRLFQPPVNGKYEPFVVTDKDWKRMTGKDGKMMKHESSKAHQSSADDYRHRIIANKEVASVAAKLSKAYHDQLQKEADEKARNREVLVIILDIIKFLTKQGLAFRGHDEKVTSDNCGNFLELVHFLGNYVPIIIKNRTVYQEL